VTIRGSLEGIPSACRPRNLPLLILYLGALPEVAVPGPPVLGFGAPGGEAALAPEAPAPEVAPVLPVPPLVPVVPKFEPGALTSVPPEGALAESVPVGEYLPETSFPCLSLPAPGFPTPGPMSASSVQPEKRVSARTEIGSRPRLLVRIRIISPSPLSLLATRRVGS
jgi:hypothetical protein